MRQPTPAPPGWPPVPRPVTWAARQAGTCTHETTPQQLLLNETAPRLPRSLYIASQNLPEGPAPSRRSSQSARALRRPSSQWAPAGSPACRDAHRKEACPPAGRYSRTFMRFPRSPHKHPPLRNGQGAELRVRGSQSEPSNGRMPVTTQTMVGLTRGRGQSNSSRSLSQRGAGGSFAYFAR